MARQMTVSVLLSWVPALQLLGRQQIKLDQMNCWLCGDRGNRITTFRKYFSSARMPIKFICQYMRR